MKVAWQFIVRNKFNKRPVPSGYGLNWSTRAFTVQGGECSLRPNHTVPYGTVPFLDTFLAVNCQATII